MKFGHFVLNKGRNKNMPHISISSECLSKDVIPLPFYGENEKESVTATNQSLMKNNRPWFPIMGEFHYSRYPEDEWQREIYKMKSGGIDIVASYVIWIHHEEEEGEWDFSNNRNLKAFIQLCQQAGLYFFLRIGPWIHGEVRNGGFPDWIVHSEYEERTNDPTYLTHVRSYFEKIYEQCEGLFFKNGGPIIGIQIENEYGHAGGLKGEAGREHMATLKKILIDIGFDVPYYTATAWGGAIVLENEMLPVFGGYVDAPWSKSLESLPANQNFLIGPTFDDNLIASDFRTDEENTNHTSEFSQYPVITAELGGGLQVTKHRRLIVEGEDTEAQALAKLASGANGLGYYMYHGGTNPIGKRSTLQESTETGSHTDVPILSYDFQAPIREYGSFHQSYGRLRKLHLFIKSFEEILTCAHPIFPEQMVTDPENLKDLRYSVRHNSNIQGGFLFINHYQRNRIMNGHGEVHFAIEVNGEIIKLPPINIKNGYKGILPYNLKIGGAIIKSSNASLLCQLKDGTLVFYHQNPDEAIINLEGASVNWVVISEDEANKSLFIDGKLYLSDAHQWYDQGERHISSSTAVKTKVYPEQQITFNQFEPSQVKLSYCEEQGQEDSLHVDVNLDYVLSKDTEDVQLIVSFIGDHAQLFLDGSLIADHFATGEQWIVHLSRFNYPNQLKLEIYPTSTKVYYERGMPIGCQLCNIEMKPIYRKSHSI